MKVDASEVKTFRECKRKWMYSSRNKYHLKPMAPKPVFTFGTLMHEALHSMYAGGDFNNLFECTIKELTDPADIRVMSTILNGYFEQVYQEDALKFKVIDIEHSFDMPFDIGLEEEIHICGAIDMIALNIETNEIWGFEHKSVRSFRPDVYMFMDEQPRLYYYVLKAWTVKYNEEHHTDHKFGGIYINECKKTVKEFNYKRTACVYDDQDLGLFLSNFFKTIEQLSQNTTGEPEPGTMKCQMCDYASLCMFCGFNLKPVDDLVAEFEEEYEVRKVDHLEEKVERHITSDED